MDQREVPIIRSTLVEERHVFSGDQWLHNLLGRLRYRLLLNLGLHTGQTAQSGSYLAEPHLLAKSGLLDHLQGLLQWC